MQPLIASPSSITDQIFHQIVLSFLGGNFNKAGTTYPAEKRRQSKGVECENIKQKADVLIK